MWLPYQPMPVAIILPSPHPQWKPTLLPRFPQTLAVLLNPSTPQVTLWVPMGHWHRATLVIWTGYLTVNRMSSQSVTVLESASKDSGRNYEVPSSRSAAEASTAKWRKMKTTQRRWFRIFPPTHPDPWLRYSSPCKTQRTGSAIAATAANRTTARHSWRPPRGHGGSANRNCVRRSSVSTSTRLGTVIALSPPPAWKRTPWMVKTPPHPHLHPLLPVFLVHWRLTWMTSLQLFTSPPKRPKPTPAKSQVVSSATQNQFLSIWNSVKTISVNMMRDGMSLFFKTPYHIEKRYSKPCHHSKNFISRRPPQPREKKKN